MQDSGRGAKYLLRFSGFLCGKRSFDARGGVYIAGGISPRIVDFIRRSQFRAHFEGKGRFREYLKAVPVNVITSPAAAFIGLTSISRTVERRS